MAAVQFSNIHYFHGFLPIILKFGTGTWLDLENCMTVWQCYKIMCGRILRENFFVATNYLYSRYVMCRYKYRRPVQTSSKIRFRIVDKRRWIKVKSYLAENELVYFFEVISRKARTLSYGTVPLILVRLIFTTLFGREHAHNQARARARKNSSKHSYIYNSVQIRDDDSWNETTTCFSSKIFE